MNAKAPGNDRDRGIQVSDDGVFRANREVPFSADGLTLHGHVLFPRVDLARQIGDLDVFADRPRILGRSGLAQAGVETEIVGDVDLEGDEVRIPVAVQALRGEAQRFLMQTLHAMSQDREGVSVGRALNVDESKSLGEEQIKNAIAERRLALPAGFEVDEDGVVSVGLGTVYEIQLKLGLLTNDNQRREFLHMGRHAVPSNSVRGNERHVLEPGEFLLTDMPGFSLLEHTLLIEPFLSVEGEVSEDVMHLSALLFDALKTSDPRVARQLELKNKSASSVELDKVKLRFRLFPATQREVNIAKDLRRWKYPDLVDHGLRIQHVLDLVGDPGLEDTVFKLVDEVFADADGPAYVFRKGRFAKFLNEDAGVSKTYDRSGVNLAKMIGARSKVAPLFEASDLVQTIQGHLSFVGGNQREAGVFAGEAFPSPEAMKDMYEQGIGVFVARHLRFDPNRPDEDHDDRFDANTYEAYKGLAAKGIRLFMEYPECKKADGTVQMRRHVREFDPRGYWVLPEKKEALDKVRTVVSFYGSFTKEIKEYFEKTNLLVPFLDKLNKLLPEGSLAITHGKGPGLMLAADEAAEALNIPRIGVGIHAETVGKVSSKQDPNYRPEAIMEMNNHGRLNRQQVMNNVANINIFNIGGAGTLEELAITLCSSKLGNNVLAPMIFVDPAGTNNGVHIFDKLRQQVDDMAAKGLVSIDDADQAKANIVTLLKPHNTRYLHFVTDYDVVLKTISDFVTDPVSYYMEQGIPANAVKAGLKNGEALSGISGVPLPHYVEELKTQMSNLEVCEGLDRAASLMDLVDWRAVPEEEDLSYLKYIDVTAEHFSKLALHPDEVVRGYVFQNPSMPVDVMHDLIEKQLDGKRLGDMSITRLLLESGRFESELVEALVELYIFTRPSRLAALCDHSDKRVRAVAAMHAETPVDAVLEMSRLNRFLRNADILEQVLVERSDLSLAQKILLGAKIKMAKTLQEELSR